MDRLFKLTATLVLLVFFTTLSFAQETNNQVRTRAMVKAQTFTGATTQGPNWVDVDGDGICDNVGTENQGTGNGSGKGLGLKDGTGSNPSPRDGTGYGKKMGANRNLDKGTSDGTGFSTQSSNSRKGKK